MNAQTITRTLGTMASAVWMILAQGSASTSGQAWAGNGDQTVTTGVQIAQDTGWCCVKGRLQQLPQSACMRLDGRYFDNAEAARRICGLTVPAAPAQREWPPEPERERPEMGGVCCVNGEIHPMSEPDCRERGGRHLASSEEAQRICRSEGPAREDRPFRRPDDHQRIVSVDGQVPMKSPCCPLPYEGSTDASVAVSLTDTNASGSVLYALQEPSGNTATLASDKCGVYGKSKALRGVIGESTSAAGVLGKSSTGFGVNGESVSGIGTTGSSQSNAGVWGRSDSGIGVRGDSVSGIGTTGASQSMDGVWGQTVSAKKSGVVGSSTDGIGVTGMSTNNHGVQAFTYSSNAETGALLASNLGAGPAIVGTAGSGGYAAVFSGRTKTTVLEITGGSDLSEQFEIRGAHDERPQPGMVVSIDATREGGLVTARHAYDRAVAGVISGAGGIRPGMLMGQKGTAVYGDQPVALSGRIYCWADASYGTIAPGDLLTSSDTPGHAMKARDHEKAQGAILGKAMSALRSGRGLILVLVSLQ